MSADRYPQIVKLVTETPWAILPEKLATIVDLVALRAGGGELSDEEIQARIGGGQAQQQVVTKSTVAILPLFGVLAPRASLMSEISGATSLERFAAVFSAAVADQEIDAILINVDSPGGTTDLVPETAAIVRDALGSKPIVAIANTHACSAAYWIGCQADEFVVTPSAMVGSIGVFAAHTDMSVLEEKAGVKTTLISAGKYKVETNPFEPLSEEARAAIQARVDDAYAMFVADVALGRGVSEASVRSGFGEGRPVTAQAAVDGGMADEVATFEATVAKLVAGAPTQDSPHDSSPPSRGLSFVDDASRAQTHVQAFVDRAESLARLRAKGGRGLSAANRELLAALNVSLQESSAALDQLLATSDNADPKVREAVQAELLRSLQRH